MNNRCGRINTTVAVALLLGIASGPQTLLSAELNLAETPLFISGSKTALVQLIMERDNKLFFEAYPSYEDINSDGVLDIRYKPDEIDYFGYFDSGFCYQSLNGRHLEATSNANNKKCTHDAWSGDFLNFLSMTRMDVMLRALYGGKRLVDTPGQTLLRRAFVPWENHTWGIEYNSVAVDGFQISDYSPLAQPTAGTRHLLSTSNVWKNDVPYLRVRENTTANIWEWVDKERSQGDGWASREIILDVEVCKSGFLEASCQQYPEGGYKPVGLLHEYGENDSMYFSLLTGSYENNLQGGVLRQPMVSFGQNEVDPATGVFTRNPGIVTALDALRIPNDYRSNTVQQDCGWITNRPFVNGECRAWGNPVAEMMYEGMRYISGIQTPTPDFFTDGGMDQQIGLSAATWDDPYSTDKPYAQCSGAYQLVISDPSPSFDGDQLPGSDFASFNGTALPGLHVGVLADFIAGHEPALPGLKFIGEVAGVADGSPSPKYVTTFRNIRGQSPEAPHRQGSYYAPSVAYYGHQNDIHPNAPGKQTVGNFTLALGSPLPSIDVDVGNRKISFAPFAKTVNFCGRNTTYKPTNAIVGFTVEEKNATSGSYRVSFEDMEQGADNDMDAVARYRFSVSGNTVTVNAESLTASGCAIQHMGFTVSGSTNDGVHLILRDSDTDENKDVDFELDVPPGATPGSGWNDGIALPLATTLTFTPSSTPAAEQLPSPLWYAAKWGGFNDENNDGIPQTAEWDANGDGTPDNYFPVTDPSRMAQTMRSVFNRISEEAGAATAVSTSSGSLQTDSRIYRADFASGKWTGDLVSQAISESGVISSSEDWSASAALSAQITAGTRQIISYNPESRTGVPFQWPANEASPDSTELSAAQVQALNRNPITDLQDNRGSDRLNYLRGGTIDGFRKRSAALGDIVHSNPLLVGPPGSHYPDNWGTGAAENAAPYSTFSKLHRDRQRVVYVGANDGMLHAFDAGTWNNTYWTAGTGRELFAYVPSPVFAELPELSDPNYSHKYYVDASPTAGDVFINGAWKTVLIGAMGRGGQGLYALDVTTPAANDETTADTTVLWEFTDREDRGIGYIYSNPVIARMHNGRWAAIIANGYNNSTRNVGYRRGGGWASVIVIDIETGSLIRKLFSASLDCTGHSSTPNSMTEPTAIDIDGDNIVDSIYAGDLYGCVNHFDVSATDAAQWPRGEVKHRAVDSNGDAAPITSAVSVGTHPTGNGVMLYFGTGKYLEPSDQIPADTAHRFYAIWDKGPGTDTSQLSKISQGNMLQQAITLEQSYGYDTDNDGVDDSWTEIRTTSKHQIDWSRHQGWYMDLSYNLSTGEQVLASPLLRDGKVIFSTHIPVGNECVPDQQGWLMILDAANGSMLDPGILDLNGDGRQNDPSLGGIRNTVNPFASPTIVSGGSMDVILSQNESNPAASSLSMTTSFADGRLTWRELQP